MKKLVITGMFLFVVLVSCGTSKEEAQDELAKVYCEKIFTCEETAAYRPFLGGSEDGCVDMMKANSEDGSDECPNYNSAKADECISCYNGLSCAEFSAMMQDEESTTCAVCDEVCE